MGVNKNQCIAETLNWVREVVIGLNLCPFAARVLGEDKLRCVVFEGRDTAVCLQELAIEATTLIDRGDTEATTLLILSQGFETFDDYLDLLAIATDLLADLNLDDALQLASFHPEYQFSHQPLSDPANYTNRSPFPMLHLLQQDSVSAVLEHVADPASIPVRNMACLRGLSEQDFEQVILKYAHPSKGA
jgi:hypothetical protein